MPSWFRIMTFDRAFKALDRGLCNLGNNVILAFEGRDRNCRRMVTDPLVWGGVKVNRNTAWRPIGDEAYAVEKVYVVSQQGSPVFQFRTYSTEILGDTEIPCGDEYKNPEKVYAGIDQCVFFSPGSWMKDLAGAARAHSGKNYPEGPSEKVIGKIDDLMFRVAEKANRDPLKTASLIGPFSQYIELVAGWDIDQSGTGRYYLEQFVNIKLGEDSLYSSFRQTSEDPEGLVEPAIASSIVRMVPGRWMNRLAWVGMTP